MKTIRFYIVQNILLIIFQVLIIQCTFSQNNNKATQRPDNEMENKLSDTESLRLTAEEFLRTIKNGDIQGFIEFLDDEGEIVIDVDTYMTKSQIANDLYRKGEIYCFVFDETKCKNTRIKKSIKKLFSTAKEIKINVAPISDIGEHLAIVEFIWDGKPPEFLDPWFKLTPKGWKLVNLFATN